MISKDYIFCVIQNCIPEFRDDCKILPFHQAFVNGSLDTLSGLNLVAVVTSTVEQPVAGLDGIVDLIRTGVVVHFP